MSRVHLGYVRTFGPAGTFGFIRPMPPRTDKKDVYFNMNTGCLVEENAEGAILFDTPGRLTREPIRSENIMYVVQETELGPRAIRWAFQKDWESGTAVINSRPQPTCRMCRIVKADGDSHCIVLWQGFYNQLLELLAKKQASYLLNGAWYKSIWCQTRWLDGWRKMGNLLGPAVAKKYQVPDPERKRSERFLLAHYIEEGARVRAKTDCDFLEDTRIIERASDGYVVDALGCALLGRYGGAEAVIKMFEGIAGRVPPHRFDRTRFDYTCAQILDVPFETVLTCTWHRDFLNVVTPEKLVQLLRSETEPETFPADVLEEFREYAEDVKGVVPIQRD